MGERRKCGVDDLQICGLAKCAAAGSLLNNSVNKKSAEETALVNGTSPFDLSQQ